MAHSALLCFLGVLLSAQCSPDGECDVDSANQSSCQDDAALLQNRVSVQPKATATQAPNMVGGCDESMSGKGQDYRGCQIFTRGGYTCQKWTSQTPHHHSRTPSRYPNKGLGDHNFCRNPDGTRAIWCYTIMATHRWDYCDPQTKPVLPGTCIETLSGYRGSGYRGCQDKTRGGNTCQKWTTQTPHRHSNTPSRRPGKGIGDHNYCRNPDNEPSIWCYTSNPKKRWEYCDPKPKSIIPPAHAPLASCGPEVLVGKGESYSGCQTITQSGKTCQKWSVQSPHAHSMNPVVFPTLGDHNRCRNPDGDRSIWCYTTDPGTRWDWCTPKTKR